MDPITSAFVNLGLGTALVVVQVWFLRYLVTATIPAMLSSHREDIAQLRGDMDRRHDENVAALDAIREHGCGRYASLPFQRGGDK